MLFPRVCGATRTGTFPAAARPDGKGEKREHVREKERER